MSPRALDSNRISLLATAFLVLTGCGVVPPRVVYSIYNVAQSSETSGDQLVFRHRRSVILIETAASDLKATATPYELNPAGTEYAPLYSITGVYDWRSSTQLKISYIDNTKFVDQLDVTTKDNVADTIDKFGKATASLLSLAAKVSGKEVAKMEFKKTILDPAVLKAGERKTGWLPDSANPGYCLQLRNVVAEPGMPIEDFISSHKSAPTNVFPVPACATGIVDVKRCANPDADALSFEVTYSTDSVIPMSLPSSGSLKMYSICGAKVTPAQSEDRTDILTYLDKAIKTVKDIKAARKTSN